jgi:hypothetical protein
MSDVPPESYIRHGRDGTTLYVGELAIKLRRAMELRCSLAAFIGPASARKLMIIAQAFTGRRYTDRLQAIADLDDWIRNMELVVPVIEEA